jgi:hypothetical protein
MLVNVGWMIEERTPASPMWQERFKDKACVVLVRTSAETFARIS